MKRCTLALWISALLCPPLQAQQTPGILAHFAGAGAAGYRHQNIFSVLQQPAALAGIKIAQAGMTGMLPYNLPELGTYQFLIAVPAGPGAFTGMAGMYGKGVYTDNRVSAGYGRRLGNLTRAGLLFHYNRVQFTGYTHSAAFSASGGLQTVLTDQLTLSFSVENPAAFFQEQKNDLYLPLLLSWGIGFEPSHSVLFSLQAQKQEDRPASVLFSMLYKPVPGVQIRAGIETGQGQCWAGAGYRLGRLWLDLGSAWHPRLGISPLMQALFYLKNEKP